MSQTIFDAAGGEEAFLRLAHAWHERCLADPVVSHAFSHGFHPQHTERLALYWAEALGGPPTYTRLRSTLEAYFRWATRRLARYPRTPDDVPLGLPLARWSWDGPQDQNGRE